MVLVIAAALAAPAERPVTLGFGGGFVTAPPSVGGFGVARGRLNLGRGALELGVREGLVTQSGRFVGAIQAGGRWLLADSLALRGAVTHHHEVPFPTALAHPLSSALGSHRDIQHRTGLEAGIGVDLALPYAQEPDRYHALVELSVAAFPDPEGPVLYGFVETGFYFDLGPRRP